MNQSSISSELQIKELHGALSAIQVDSICYISINNKILEIYTTDHMHQTRSLSLEQISTLLPNNFCRCHKGFIVNMNYIETYSKTKQLIKIKCTANTKQFIDVGRKYKTDFENKLNL